MAHEINIAALLREDTRTIYVALTNGTGFADEDLTSLDASVGNAIEVGQQKYYNYVTNFNVKEGDAVLVEYNHQMKVAVVCDVHDTVKIDPGLPYELRWVIQKLDFTEHRQNILKNKEIKQLVQQAYQSNLRRSFRQQLLSGLDGSEEGEKLVALLGAK